MSHEGRMRRGEMSKDATNIDRIYFLEQTKPVQPEELPLKQVKKKVDKDDSD